MAMLSVPDANSFQTSNQLERGLATLKLFANMDNSYSYVDLREKESPPLV
jgi:hypothetical protein